MRIALTAASFVVLSLVLAGCVGESTTDGPTLGVCINGETRDCMCAAGTADTSRCIDGTWTACNCSVIDDATAMSDMTTDDTGEPDTSEPDTAVATDATMSDTTVPSADTSTTSNDAEDRDVVDKTDVADVIEPPQGVEGAYCDPGEECNDGLVCRLDRCVRVSSECTSDFDRAAVEGDPAVGVPTLADVSFACGEPCISDPDPVACVLECTLQNESQANTSEGCATCFAERLACALDNGFGQNCVTPCLTDPDGSDCTSCMIETGCFQRLHACTGLPGCGDAVCNNGETSESCPSDCDLGGACQNATDQSAISAARPLEDIVAGCLVDDCLGSSDTAPCIVTCVEADNSAPPASEPCISCFGQRYGCVVNECLSPCLSDINSDSCIECRINSGCEDAFAACSGESSCGDGVCGANETVTCSRDCSP